MPELAHRDAAALGRVMGGMTVRLLRDQRDREDQLALISPGDFVQQVQVRANGSVGADPIMQEPTVKFPMPFMMRVDPTRTSGIPTEAPHFSYGVELLTAGFVVITAQVRSWVADESNFVTGAKVRIGAWSPGGARRTAFNALVHLSFMGFASPVEDDSQS